MAAKLLLRNLLTVIKKFALPQGLSRNLSFDSSELALEQCGSYHIAEARRPGQLPRSTKRFSLFSVKAIALAAILIVAGLGFSNTATAQQASNVTVNTITSTTARVASWTNNSGNHVVVFILKGSTGTPTPVNGTHYSGNVNYGSGNQIGSSGWYSLLDDGSGQSTGPINITGLTANTTYRIMVVDYNSNSSPSYTTGTGTNNPINFTTLAAPTVSETGSLAAFATTTYGTPSASQNFSVSGSNLTANLVVTPPTGFEVSTNNSTFTSTVSLTPSSGTVASTTVYIRLSATAAGTFSGNAVVSSTGATSINVAAPSSTVNKVALTVSGMTANDKVYDRTTTASFTGGTLVGIVNSDVITLTKSGTFATANVGSGLAVTSTSTISGTQSANYTLTQPTGLSASITAKTLTVTGITASSRPYDGTTNVTLTGTAALSGVVSGDGSSVTLGGSPTASFADPNVGTSKSVTVNGYTISGSASGNYTLTQPTLLTANITAVNLNVTNITADNKLYDRTTAATFSGTPTLGAGVVNGDVVTLNTGSATASFTSAAVGNGKTVNVSGFTITQPASNYNLVQPTALTANITPVSLTLPDAAANNKPYDGNTNATITGTLTGILSGDVVTLNGTGTFASSAVGNGIAVTSTSTLGGAQAGNYTLTQPTGLSANIIGNTLTITATPQNKVYGVALSQVTGATQFTATGLAPGETVSSVTLNFGSGSASFDPVTTYSGSITPSAPVGSYNPANYNIVYVNGDLTVTKAQLNVTGITASNKVYDGTTSATITGTPALSGVLNNDDVSLVTGSVTSVFTSAAVGSNKTVNVNGYSISGGAIGNYNLVQPTTLTANITGAPLTLTATGPLKSYGVALTTGTSATNFTASGMVGSETVTSVTLTPDAAGQSATTAVGSPYVITPSLPTGGGGFLASNYIITPVAYNGTVTAPSISYAGTPYTFIRFTGITTVTPTTSGGSATYAISPSLNNNTGLTFSTSSGNISGTPNTNNGPTTYTVTATYSGGVTAQTTLSVTVVSSVSLTYTGSPFTYNYGIAISPLTPGGNGTPSSYTVSPALPTGLSLNATTGVVSGTPLQVVSTGTNYVVTSHYTGTNNTATATLNIKVNAPTLTYSGSPFTYVAGTPISSLSPSGSSGATGYSVSPALPAGLSIDPGTGIVSGTPTAAASAATYVVTATYSGGATAQATLNIQVNSPTLSYAGSPFTFVISKTITPANPTFTGTPVSYSGTLPDGLSVNSSTGQITGAPTTLSDAALYTITANYAAGITATANVSIAVVNPTLTITANNKTMAYGASVPALDVTYNGFINGDDASSVTGLSVTTTGTSTSNVGTYPITASGATAPSYYTIVYAPGTLTITAAPVTITGLTANNKPYDRTNTATFTGGTLSGVMVADQPNVTLVPSGTFATANAGNGIAVTSTSTLTGSAASNYAITQPTGLTANITQIALTITANDVTKTYSATLTNGSSTAFTSAGLISPETIGSVTMTYGTGAASTAAVGNYPGQATPSAATGGSFTAANYNITYVSGAINVVNPTITYPATTYTFLRNTGTNITTITPTITGSPTSGSGLISPSLNTNTGLTFSTTTGAFSGRPSTASAMTPYTITFSYPGGATAQTTVNVAVVTSVSLSYAGTPFTFSYGNAITPLSPTVTASPLSYSVSPALPTGLSLNTSTGVISGTPTVVQGQNTYTVTATYNNTTTTAQVRITVTAPTLSYSGSPFTYYTGTAISSLSPTVSTTPNNYTVSPALPAGLSLDPSTGIVSGTPTAAVAAGNYVISANYNGGVTAQATLNIQVQAPTLSYAGTPFTFTLNTAITPASPTVTGAPVSYSVSPALPTALTVDPSTGIISGTPAATSAASNYTITANYAGGVTAQAVISVTVNNPTLTITADNQTMTYGSAVPTLTISYSGFINGDTPASLTTPPSISTTATSASPVGSYPISISGAVAPAYYNVVYVQGNVTVSPIQLTITGMTAANKVYNKTTTATLSGGTLVGVLAADQGNVTLVQTGAFATASAGNGVAVNSTSTITGSAISNYTLVQPTGITANITKKPLNVPTSGLSLVTPRIYNQTTAAQLTGSLTSSLTTSNGVISGDVGQVFLGGSLNPPTGTFLDANAGTGKTINVSSVTLTGPQSPNYSINITITGDITPAPVGLASPAGVNKVYDGTTAATITGTLTGTISGDQVTFNGIGNFVTASAGNGISIVPAITLSGAQASNYAVSQPTGVSANITKAPLTITANNQTKQYGTTFNFTGSEFTFVNVNNTSNTGALYASDNISSVNFTSAGAAASASVTGGPYSIVPSGAAGSGVSNYNISYVNGSMTVTSVAIAVAADPQTKNYGDADPALTYQITSGALANSDTFTGSLTRAPGENVGTYAISQGSLALSSNYSLSFTGNNLNIGTRSIAVTADPQSKSYGDSDPPLTYQITSGSLANGDTFSGSLTRAPGEIVGTYAISQGSLALSSNYNLSFTGNNLLIGTRAIAVAADPQTKNYGDADPTLSYQVTSGNLVNGDAFSGSPTRASGEDVGTYAISQGSLALSSNYNLSFTGDNLTIGTRSIAVTADPQSKNYGDADPALTYQITSGNLVNGDTFSGALTRASGENVGSYAISQGSLALSPNYNLSFTSDNLTIGTRPIAVAADPQSKNYGEADPALTYQITSGNLVNGDTFSGALTRAPGEDVGSYAISQGSLALSPNYNLSFTGDNLTIDTRSIAVTADPQTKTYGDNDPTLTYQITNGSLANGDTFTGALTRVTGEDVGSYDISQGTLALSGNYALTVTGNTLNIGTRSIAVAADPQTKNYGDSDPTLSYQITSGSLAFEDTFSGTLTRTSGEDVGTYPISQGSLVLSPNYNLSFTGNNLTIGTRSIAVTADPQTKSYGDNDPTLTYQITNGSLANGDTFSGALTRASGENVGTYAISQGSLALSSNYALSFTGDNLTIGTRSIAVTADPQTKNYGDNDPALTYQYTGTLVNGDAFSGALTRAAGENVGTYAISQGSLALSPNYNLLFTGDNLTIGTRAIAVAADPQSKNYGEADPALTYQITSGTLVNGDTFSGALTRAPGEDVGSYAISQGSLALSDNYALSFTGNSLSIGTRSITVTAGAQTKNYGDSDPTLSYQVTSGSLASGDSFTGSLTRASGENVGTYAISQGSLALPSNYNVTFVGNNLTIGTRSIAVAADHQTKNYGDNDPTLSYQITSGNLVNGDTFSGALTRVTGEDVGSYDISQGSLALSDNYALTVTGNTLTIGTRAIAVTADPQTKNYGDNDPTLTYQVTSGNLVNGDTFSGALTRAAGENVGTYAISQGTLALSANYNLSFTGDNLTIGTRPIAVTADPQTKNYGDADPTLTYQVTSGNLVNGDTFNGSLTRATGENVGTYAISQGSLALSANYNLSFTGDNLTIGTRAIAVAADPQSKNYGEADPALTYQITSGNLVNGDTFTGALIRAPGEDVGSYAISQGSLALSSNYNLAFTGNNLTIGTRSIAVAADAKAKNYGDADPALTYQITSGNLVNGDVFSGALTRAPGENVGSYAISQGTLALSANYNLSFTGSNLTIGTKVLTITANNDTKVYGESQTFAGTEFVAAGLKNGDNINTVTLFSAGADASAAVNNYPIVPSNPVAAQGTNLSNYDIHYVNGTDAVGQAILTVKADNKTIFYGDPIPQLTVSYSGFVNNETYTDLPTQATASTTATSASGVGDYVISVGGAIDNNYSFNYVNGNLRINAVPIVFNPILPQTYGAADLDPGATSNAGITYTSSNTNVATIVSGQIHIKAAGSTLITANNGSSTQSQTLIVNPAPLTVTADNQSKAYGANNPALTVSYSGFVNGDTQNSLTTQATATTTATVASPVGSYPINVTGGAVDPNYTFTYVAGTLTVGKATLTVTADNSSKVYGAANPAFTVSYSGFMNGDTKTNLTTQATVSTSATTASPVGSYDLVPAGAASSNYNFTYVNGTLNVTPAGLLITANNQTKAYGAGIPPFTANFSGFVNGDNSNTALSTQPTLTTTATASSPIGTYPITASGAVAANYTITYAPGTLTVGQANLVITPDPISKVYGAAIPTLTASYSGFANGDTPASLTTQPTLSTTATASSPIGTYLITATGASSPNYNITYNTGNLTVTPATLTITANNLSKTYGTANPTLTVSYSGFVNGETRNNLTTRPTITTTATTTSPAGAYPITASGAVDPNYTFVYVPGTLTVNPAVLTVTAADKAKTYGANNPNLTVTYSGWVNGDTQTSLTTPATATTTATATSPVGDYPITPAGAVNPNYTFNYVGGTLTVGQATLTIAANTMAKTYGSPNPALTVSYSGFVNGDSQANLLGQPIVATTATNSSPVGNYPITASGAYSPNYNINYLQGTMIVTQVALFISADNQTKVAGAANPTLTASYSGFVNGDTQANLTTQPTLSTTATTNSPAGTYPISVSGAVDPNYSIAYASGTMTVTSTPLTFAAIPAKTYGAADFDPGASSASPITYTSSNPAVATIVSGNIHIIGVGNSVITATSGSSSQTQLLIVNPASLTIIANGVTKSYGVALTGGAGSTGTFFPLGLVNGEAIGSVTITYGSGAAASAAVGTYNGSVTASAATGGTFNPNNYSINYVSNNITVQAVALTITANNQAKNYGSANPALTLSYSGFVNGDNQASLSTPPTVSTSAVTNSPVGSYPINVSGAASNNYSISYNNGTLTVGQAALVISADNHAKNYGSVNPALTITYSGFVNGENSANLTTLPTISTTATTSSPIGNYPITVSGAVDGNYSISYTAGTMTVTPAALTITADNQSKVYGSVNPALTISYSGFVNGESQSNLNPLPVASTSATTASGVGSYPITVSGAVNPNYSFIYNAGTLTVTPALLTITANNQTKTQGAANPPLTLSYSGYVNGDNQASLSTPPTVSTTATTNSPVGPYPITVGGASDPDYTFSYVQGTLTVVGNPLAFGPLPSKIYGAGDFNAGATSSNSITYTSSNPAVATIVSGNIHIVGAGSSTITANDGTSSLQQTLNVATAPLTVTANNASKTYGAANPALSVGYSGFVNGDTQANLTAQASASTAATVNSAVGTYAITASGAASNNYSITYNAGTLTVGQASLTITANNQSKTYGAANPSLTVGYSGFVNGDNNTTALTTQATVSTSATVSSPVGSYPISASGAVSANYSISYAQGTLTIGQAALTITADNQSKVQGAANPTLTASYNGFVNGDTQANLTTLPTVTTTATTGSPAGTYPITASGAASANYSMSYVQGTLTVNGSLTFNAIASKVYGAADFNPGATSTGGAITYSSGNTAVATIVSGNIHIVGVGTSTITANNGTSSLQQTLTVTPAALTATANNQSKTYGSANPSLTVSYSGFVNGENSSVVTTLATVTTTATASSAVGSYPITASGANAANYSISYVQGTLTIGQAALTITANNQTMVQGSAVPTLTVNYSGFVNGETNTALTTQPTVSTTATSASAAGTYPITASGAVDANYTISYVAGTMTVTASTPFTFAAIPSKVYGTADFNPGATGSGTITYTSGNTAVATIVSGNIHIVGVGTSTITANNGASSLQQTLTVTRAPLTITANAVNKTYGATLTGGAGSSAFTPTGLVNGQTVGTVTIAYGTGSAANAAVNTYTGSVTPSAATGGTFNANNYTITYTTGNIVVGRAPLTITANAVNKTYGSTLTGGAGSNAFTSTGLVNGQTIGTVTIAYGTGSAAAAAVGTYAGSVTPSAATGGSFNANNYTITYNSGNIVVGTKALTITATAVNKTYGATLTGAAGSTAFTSTGLVTGQTIGSVTMAYGTGSAATAAVGTYAGAATPSAATGGSFTASNYAITYTSGNIVVGRANVMITADNKTKVRGTANPPLTVTYSGFVNGQTNVVLTTQPTVTTNANTNSPVGSYAITASGAVAANYSFTYVQGTLTVTAAAALTFNAIPAQTYGATDFNPGATTGNGTVTYTSGNSAVATIVSGNIHIVGVGTSTITANDGTSSSQQTLTVNPATLTIYAYDINKNYGSPLNNGSGLPYFTPNGLKYGETIGSVTIAFGAAAATNTVVGTYANQVTASAATGGTFKPGCYNITYVQGKIIVNKKVLTITAANKSKAQGTANPALTVTYSGFANGETNSALSTQPSASTTATINSPMGNYPITANGAAANNYSFTYVQGTLTITNPSNASIISVNNPEHVTYVPVEEPVVRQAVSPNGDGINDVLHIDNIESYPDNKVMLMNRNGTTIYEMTGYDNTNKVFDGHSNITKEMQQPGTYFYMVEYKVKGGETKRKTGYFVIKY